MGTRDGHPGLSPDVVVFGHVRVPRRWPWILAAVVLIAAGAVVVVVRPLAAAAEFRALRSRWTAAVAVDLGRNEAIARLARQATPSDLAAVTAAVLAVQRQEADRLAVLRAGAAPGLTGDGTVSALAGAERTALSREVRDLRGAPLTAWSGPTDSAIGRVQTLLAAGQRRFGAATTSPRPTRLTAADGALLRLQRVLDESVPAELLVTDNSMSQTIDLRSGSVHPAPSALQGLYSWQVLPRAGFMAVQAGGEVFAVRPPFTGTRRPLGAGQMLAAARPDAVWILSSLGQGVLVTGAGRRIAGPVPVLADLPGSRVYANVSGLAVPGGLVVEKDRHAGTPDAASTGLWLWNPGRGPQLLPLVRGCAHPIAAQGRLLAWLGCDPIDPARVRMHITDTATGADRVIANPATAVPFLADQPTAAFSPSGRWLAAYYAQTTSVGYALGLVNTRTGVTSIIRGAPVADATAGTPIMWTSDSTRVFFATGASRFDNNQPPWVDGTVPLATYRVGARSAVDLRWHEPGATLLAVLPAGPG